MKKPAFVQGFAAQLPPFHRPQEEGLEWLAAAHARAAATACGRDDELPLWHERMGRLARRYSCPPGHIGWRRSELADFMHTDWPRMHIFNLHENPRGRGLGVRNRFFTETANRVVQCLFAGDSHPPSDLLHVSCTGYASPSPIQRLIESKKWNTRTHATQVYHMGCYAALPALRVAAGLLSDGRGSPARRAEIVHTELCTLHFDPGDHSPEQLVVQSLFADGHIRYTLTPEAAQTGGRCFELLSLREEIVPDSLDDMTWVLSEWGFRMTLSRDVPGRVAACLPRFLSDLLCGAGLKSDDAVGDALFAVHPGGPRILDSVRELLRLREDQVALSREVLFRRGDMSSATLPHIWMAVADDPAVRSGTVVVSLAFGPGLTVAGALFRKC